MEYIDSHAHLMDEAFDLDRDDLIQEINNDEKLKFVINVGYDMSSSFSAVQLADEYEKFYAIIGMHPHDSKDYNDGFEDNLIKIAKSNKKVIAIGEIGLDYHYDLSERNIQREVFLKQAFLAKKIGKPISVHTREAANDTYVILKDVYGKNDAKGVIHSFSYSKEMAKLYMDMGFYLSFSGPITFKNAQRLRDVVSYVPLERILVETDCPYLTPVPNRGKRNNPLYVKYVIEKIAEIKDLSVNEVCLATYKNTLDAFEINI